MADETTTAEPQDDFDVPLDTPESGPPGPAQQPGAEPDTGAPTFPPELAEALRRERLPAVPGETTEAAYSRLATHLQGRNRQLYTTLKDGERARKQELAELRASLDPILREHYRRQHQAAIEEQAAQIPDRETDPEGYRLWVNEEVLRRLDAYEQGAEEQALTAEQQEAQRRVQEQLATIDDAGYGKVAVGLGLVQGTQPDPEFQVAYDTYSEAAITAARSYFPEASDQQIEEFVALSQQMDIRRAEMNGVDIRDVMKGRFNALVDGLVRRGYVTRAQAAAAKADAAAGGNGQPQQAQQQVQRAGTTSPAPPVQPTKSVVERMRTDAAAAQRRAPNAVAATTRPSPGAGQLPDTTGLDEDDYVEAAIAGLLGNEEQRTASHRRSR